MPWESAAQRGWGHSPAGIEALGGPARVAEWDQASKGKSLPAKKTSSDPAETRRRGLQALIDRRRKNA